MKALSFRCIRAMLVISFFSLSFPLFAQKETFTGYYVSTGGDTVHGTFPNYRQWDNSPGKVSFVPLSPAAPVVLTPEACRMFHISGYESYVPYTGTRLVNQAEFNAYTLTRLEKDSTEEIAAFLRVAFSNDSYRLLVYNGTKRKNFFIQKTGKQAEELKYKMYIVNMQLKEEAVYRQQLAAIFNDGTSRYDVNRLLEEVLYNEKSLTRFLEKITGTHAAATKPKRANKKNGFVITGGFTKNDFQVKSDNNVEANTEFNTSYSPLIGLGYMVRSDRNFGKLFFLPQVRFFRFKNQGELKTSDYRFDITYQSRMTVNFGINIGYDLLRTRMLSWYVAPGASVLYLPGNKKSVITYYAYSPNPVHTVYPGVPMRFFNLNVQTGFTLKDKWSVWGNYGLPSHIMSSSKSNAYLKTLQAGISYKWKK